jgi:hypothetical protein
MSSAFFYIDKCEFRDNYIWEEGVNKLYPGSDIRDTYNDGSLYNKSVIKDSCSNSPNNKIYFFDGSNKDVCLCFSCLLIIVDSFNIFFFQDLLENFVNEHCFYSSQPVTCDINYVLNPVYDVCTLKACTERQVNPNSLLYDCEDEKCFNKDGTCVESCGAAGYTVGRFVL